jgi:hydroxypyruvate isomerase
VENLAWAAPLAADAGVTLLIEPLNAMDFPACVLHGPSEAMGIIGQVNHPQVKLQFDVYHAQMTEGNLINSITNCLPNIGHIQIADVPGRHQPGTGKIDYPATFDLLRKLNYSGFVGLEYRPSNDSDSSLAWLPREERAQSCM